MVVFRPFKGEILQATISKINKDGIQCTFLVELLPSGVRLLTLVNWQ